MQKIIGFDIDGVLTTPESAPWEEELTAYFNIPIQLDPDEGRLRDKYGFTDKQMQEFFHTRSHFVIPKLIMREGANSYLQELKAQGFTIVVITARTESPETPKWLAKNDIPYDLLIHAEEKLTPCLEHGLQLFVEDNLSNAEAISAEIPVLLMDVEYNRVENLPKGVFRVYNFNEIRQFVNEHFAQIA